MTRLLPPVLFLALFIPLGLLDVFHPPAQVPFETRTPPWDVPLALGVVLLIWARVQFRRADSEIMTFHTPRNMVTQGAFRLSRNPMYLGFTLLLLGGALFVNLWCAFLIPIAFFAACNWWYIPAEEENMRQTFGKTYDDYAWRVRRWL